MKANVARFAAYKSLREEKMVNQLLADPKITQKQKAVLYAENAFKRYTQTELDTVTLRAHSARDWERFQAEKDVLPNLEWVPSTSAIAGEDHRVFWGVTLPVDDEFWQRHRPGDRWNCKCRLRATDKPATRRPKEDATVVPPAVGLEENPAKTGAIFSQKTPYFARATASDDYEVFKMARNAFQKEKTESNFNADDGTNVKIGKISYLETSRLKGSDKEKYFLKLEILRNFSRNFDKLEFVRDEKIDLSHNSAKSTFAKLKNNFTKMKVYKLKMGQFIFEVKLGENKDKSLFLYIIK